MKNTRIELIALAPAWIAMAWLISKAQWFWTHRPDLQFGWVVVMLCAYLVFDGWEKRPVPQFKFGLWAALAGAAGAGLLFVVQIYQAAFGTMAASLMGLSLAVFCVVGANLLYVYGWRGVRHFAFGFGFLLIALPMPSALHGPIVNGLQSQVATVNVEVLNLIGIPATRVGSLIHLPSGTVGVDEACSGIRSLQSTVMATLFIGYLTLRRFAMQVLLLIAGIALAIFGNVVRSLFLSYVANRDGIEAVESFHDSAGWSILAFTALGVAALSWLFSKAETAADSSVNSTSRIQPDGAAELAATGESRAETSDVKSDL